MTENKNVFGILGHPLGHTLSPQIHTRLFEISGEQAEYKILDTPPEKLTDSFEYFKSLTGFNITIPYKIDIIKMCDTLDDTAKRYNSVNCIANVNGVSTGYNTDYKGGRRNGYDPYKQSITARLRRRGQNDGYRSCP